MKNQFKKYAIALFSFAFVQGVWAAQPEKVPSYADRAEVQEFIQSMHEKHGLMSADLNYAFSKIKPNTAVLRAIRPAAVPELQRSWERYRERFITDQKIEKGVLFWKKYKNTLARAEAKYSVPAEVIVSIIGVETDYGNNTGKFRVLEALSSLAFDYPPRADYFKRELEQYLLLAEENDFDLLQIRGSYAGAIGIAQFMPSSYRDFAVDFDGNGVVDLRKSAVDAIGSVANYLESYGWKKEEPIAVPVKVKGNADELIALGIKPALTVAELSEKGVLTDADAARTAALIDLVSPNLPTEYWLGFDNFYVITRYNRSSFYAMAVFQLAENLREEYAISNTHQK